MLNENKKPIPNYFCFFIFLNSKFDVGRSMFICFQALKRFNALRNSVFWLLYSEFSNSDTDDKAP